MDRKQAGILLTTLSAVLFGVTPAVTSVIYQMGGNAVTLTFYRNLMVVPVLLALMKYKGISFRVTGREVGLILLIGVGFRATTTLMLFQSYDYIPTGMSTTLHFLYPVVTALLCRLLFRERLGPWKAAALALAGAGMLCFLELGQGVDLRGVALAVCSSVTYSGYLIGMDQSALREMHPYKTSCYIGLSNGLAMLAVGLPTGQLQPALAPAALGLTFLLALATSFGAVALLQAGIQRLGASSAAIFSMFEPITSVLVGALFLAEPVTPRSALGCVLILAGVALVALAGRREAAKSHAGDGSS